MNTLTLSKCKLVQKFSTEIHRSIGRVFFPQLITEISSVGTRSTDFESKEPSASDGEATVKSLYDVISWTQISRFSSSRDSNKERDSAKWRALRSPGTRISQYNNCIFFPSRNTSYQYKEYFSIFN